MKSQILIFFLIIYTFHSFGQENQKCDTVFQLNSSPIICKVISINEFEILYSYPSESLTNVLSKKQIKEIHFASGRVQKFSEKIIIYGEEDWQKVVITTIQSDILGLIKKCDVKGRNTGTMLSDESEVKTNAEEKIKREAAKCKCHIIFVQTYTTRSKQYWSSTLPKTDISGVAYSYE